MPASMLLDGEYGEKDVLVGVPVLLGKNGAERVLELPLTAEELANFHKCCDDVRKNIKTAEGIAAAECKIIFNVCLGKGRPTTLQGAAYGLLFAGYCYKVNKKSALAR